MKPLAVLKWLGLALIVVFVASVYVLLFTERWDRFMQAAPYLLTVISLVEGAAFGAPIIKRAQGGKSGGAQAPGSAGVLPGVP